MPELAGGIGGGSTYQETVANAEIVVREWAETAKELGRPIPEPKEKLCMPKRGERKRAGTLVLWGEKKRAGTLVLWGEKKRAGTLVLWGEKKRAGTLVLWGEKKRAGTLVLWEKGSGRRR